MNVCDRIVNVMNWKV